MNATILHISFLNSESWSGSSSKRSGCLSRSISDSMNEIWSVSESRSVSWSVGRGASKSESTSGDKSGSISESEST